MLYPSRTTVTWGYVRQAFGMATWPIRYVLTAVAAPVIARWSSRRLFEICIGLDANLYPPHLVEFDVGPGFPFNNSTISFTPVLASSIPKASPERRLLEGASAIERMQSSLEQRAVELLQGIELVHSRYYC